MKQPGNQLTGSVRNYIAKTVFTYTQTMGLTDRTEQEELTVQVISKLEKIMSVDEQTRIKRAEPVLPGMEHLVAPVIPQPPSKDQIENIVNELIAEKSVSRQQSDTTAPANKIPLPAVELNLSENALIVLEKRYLIKDSRGNVVETPVDLFRRVSRHIASAESVFDKKANTNEW